MSGIVKFLGSEVTLSGTGNTVASSVVTRLVNKGASAHVVTLAGKTFTVLPGSELTVKKGTADTLSVDSGSDVVAAPVAFTN